MPGLGRGWKRIWALLVAGCLSLLPGMREGAAQDPDDTAWQAARTAGSVEAFQEYLDQFPDGRHSDAAFAGIVVEAKGMADLAASIGDLPAAGPAGALLDTGPAGAALGGGAASIY